MSAQEGDGSQGAPAGPRLPTPLAEARVLFRDGDIGAAVAVLERALADAPGDAACRELLMRCHLRRGERERAGQEAARLAALDDAGPAGLVAASTLLSDPAEAERALRRALASEARAEWKARLAVLLLSRPRRLPESVALAREVAASKDASAQDCASAAMCLWRDGDAAGAREAIAHALELHDAQKPDEKAKPAPALWRAMAAELDDRRRGGARAASGEVSPVFYDIVYEGSPVYAAKPGASPYLPLWRRVIAHLRRARARRVLDVGCGPGQFADFLTRKMPEIAYTGLDFSPVAIAQARERCAGASFLVADALRGEEIARLDYDAVVCTETLEHVEDDRGLLRRLRPGTAFVGSVPSFDSFGHVRYFDSARAVRVRYHACFAALKVETVTLESGARLFLIAGRLAGPDGREDGAG